jgi:diguanylate cyclase (GGDEF)-like protein
MEPTSPVKAESVAPTRRLPCLVVVAGREPGRIIPLQRAAQVLGRDERVGIRLEDQGVSRRHARFRLRAGRVRLEDLKSTNGSFRNGKRVEEAVLEDGDRLQFGTSRLTFRMNHPDEGRLLRMLYHRATRDPLTRLLNRASLEDRLHREVERHKRYGRGLAVVQLDLDRFKEVNDTHGHAAGDKVLRLTARTIRQCLRASDLAARIGGDEFLLVLPECNLIQARAIAEKIRTRLAAIRVAHQGKALRVSVSMGAAAACGQTTTAAKLLAAADAVCYRAKRGGRDRVE